MIRVREGELEPELGSLDSQVLFPAVVPFFRTPLYSFALPLPTFCGMCRPTSLLQGAVGWGGSLEAAGQRPALSAGLVRWPSPCPIGCPGKASA